MIDRYDVVVSTRLDRLSRSSGDLLNTIPTLEEIGITLFFCEQFGDMPIVYPKQDGKTGLKSRFDMSEMANKIMLMVLSAVAEIEHATIKSRTKLVEIPEEQNVLKTIYRLRDRGLGARRIEREVNSLHPDAEVNTNKIRRILGRKFQGIPASLH